MKSQFSIAHAAWVPQHRVLGRTAQASAAALLLLSSCASETPETDDTATSANAEGPTTSSATVTPPVTTAGPSNGSNGPSPSATAPAPQPPTPQLPTPQPEPGTPDVPTPSSAPDPTPQPEPNIPGSPITGGASNAGGNPPVGGATGEAGSAPSGVAGEGGSATAGMGGAGTGQGGVVGAAGAASSLGCSASTWPSSDRYSIDVGGTTREYLLDVPEDYDPNTPYRLIFGWHWRGGSAENVAAAGGPGGGQYYGLKSRADGTAIFVAPEGLDAGWANPGGRDIDFLRAMLERLQGELCIDSNRIFSTGFSYGGMMSLAVGCGMGDVFRAIAPMSGAFYSGCDDGDHPVAFWGAHGDEDDVVPLADGEEGRDEFLARNHCDTTTESVEPSPCVTYQGCDAGYPVTWCEFSGGHSPPNFSGQALWDFFSQF